ncbi:MAG: hypothetical protein KBT34_00345 [Prevotella sp.]|nr:hypothetical protein [Candidatus Prevotella equi]
MEKLSRFHVGGYGEIAYSRNFYSDRLDRYKLPEEAKSSPSHGRFDIPHFVLYLGYDFGKGWTFNTEIEFEHGGTSQAYEKESEEGGEWEFETEKGGEVELEQFWIQKSFMPQLNLRIGHIIVPVGLNNAHHEPLNFFTVYRPEGENAILPSTWHQTGVSIWGKVLNEKLRYEAQFLAGLNADNFTTSTWVNRGCVSPLEFDIANKYGMSARLDYYITKGMRAGISGYYGHTQGNSYPAQEIESKNKGELAIGSIDFTMDRYGVIVRAQADYGHLGDTKNLADNVVTGDINTYNRGNKKSPYHHTTGVGSNAYAIGIETGYDIFHTMPKCNKRGQRLIVFGRYDRYNACADSKMKEKYGYLDTNRIAFGINYMPLKGLVIKGDYSQRILKSPYNNEPSLNIGVAYQGWFL